MRLRNDDGNSARISAPSASVFHRPEHLANGKKGALASPGQSLIFQEVERRRHTHPRSTGDIISAVHCVGTKALGKFINCHL
jgi:hypothetical protein